MGFGLQRSLIFWAGVLVTVFICWAAWDSWEQMSGTRVGAYEVGSVGAGVAVVRDHVGGRGGSDWEVFRRPVPDLSSSLASGLGGPFFLRGRAEPPYEPSEFTMLRTTKQMYEDWAHSADQDDWVFFLPYWLLWLGMALLWAGLLVWRQSQRRRGAEVVDSSGER